MVKKGGVVPWCARSLTFFGAKLRTFTIPSLITVFQLHFDRIAASASSNNLVTATAQAKRSQKGRID
jgi:hypothetical protein